MGNMQAERHACDAMTRVADGSRVEKRVASLEGERGAQRLDVSSTALILGPLGERDDARDDRVRMRAPRPATARDQETARLGAEQDPSKAPRAQSPPFFLPASQALYDDPPTGLLR